MRQQNGCRLSIYFPFLLVDGNWPCVLPLSVSRRKANTVAVFYTSVDSKSGGEVCLSCLQSTHSSIHPPIGSEINPFSDCWLVARGFQTKPQAAGPGGGKKPKRKKKTKKLNPTTDQRKRIQSETKQKLRLLGLSRWLAHLQVSHPLWMSVCEYVTFRHSSCLLGGGPEG